MKPTKLMGMQFRKLGRTSVEVSDIGYGAWGIGGKQWLGGTDDESLLALRRAIELGVNLIDTALAYGDGHSEQLVGDAVRSAGRRIYVATKVPPKNGVWPAKSGTPIADVFPYGYLIASAEESLRNLKLETIDLLQLHVWTDEWVACGEWRRAFEDLKRSGKVQSVGVSATEHDPDSALAIMRTGLIDAVQVIYNIFDQTPEARMLPLAQEMNIGILARVPPGRGRAVRQDDRNHYLPGRRFPRVLLPRRRSQETGDAARRCVAPGPRRRRQPARYRAPLLPVAPGRVQRHPRHAFAAPRGSQYRSLRSGSIAGGDSGDAQAPRLGS